MSRDANNELNTVNFFNLTLDPAPSKEEISRFESFSKKQSSLYKLIHPEFCDLYSYTKIMRLEFKINPFLAVLPKK